MKNRLNLPVIVIISMIFLLAACDSPETTTPIENNETPVEEQEATENEQYQDGTYTSFGNYVSPAGDEEVDVSVTLKDGVIASASFTGKTEHPTSKKLQDMFNTGFEAEVVGKSIDEVDLSVVNGSSLTPEGFMDALNKIKTQASK